MLFSKHIEIYIRKYFSFIQIFLNYYKFTEIKYNIISDYFNILLIFIILKISPRYSIRNKVYELINLILLYFQYKYNIEEFLIFIIFVIFNFYYN